MMEIKTTLYPDSRVTYNTTDQILTIISSNNRFELKVHPMVLRNIVESINEDLKLEEENQNDE